MTAQIGREALDTADFTAVRDLNHLGEFVFRALGRAAAQVAFTTFGANQSACPSHTEPFGGCLVCFQLELLTHDNSLQTN